MHRKNLLGQIDDYQLRHPDEHSLIEKFRAFVKEHSNCFERSLQKGHITSSAWLLDSTGQKVLLTHHKKLGKWLQLGGHADGETDVLKVAIKEAQEESGIREICPLDEGIFDLDIHTIPARSGEPEHKHYDVRFLLRAKKEDYQISQESHNLAWLTLAELEKMELDDSVRKMVRKWRALTPRLFEVPQSRPDPQVW